MRAQEDGRPDRAAAPAAWLASLRRPLATDDAGARFWVRHLRIGVVLTMGSCVMVVVYALTAASRPRSGLLAAVALATLLATPLLLRLPMLRMAQDWRGRPFFYAWSLLLTLVVAAVAALDGGGTSLLVLLFTLTLSYAAVAYPPGGVAALGSGMVVADVLVSLGGPLVHAADRAVPAGVLALFVVMATWTSYNRWEAHEQQLLLAQTLEVQATTDPLTGSLNRRALVVRLHESLSSGRAEGADRSDGGGPRVGLCLVDLDGFKAVNDGHGHAAGDDLLVAIARALRAVVRETDAVARLGGDEFAVLTSCPPPPAELAERVRAAVAAAGLAHGVTASVGVATSEPGDETSHLLHRADVAMYRAKQDGGDRVAAAPPAALSAS